ncbi:DUF2269 family protein [Deinococcus cellulosilyticus]|uniref:DUF2269 family protein n=1 Tax=Deinococcus cellulosilyticus (strain DSM 18568 / NBRC 106333 / KACC 11606 / 5516J-15) TaxID=1223518 RepID=A0A511N4Z0_DEIC1|nr:DUF2269 family protein [Deinococcus cellulosilyticus]GEM47516.1 hypothetical protein DC3_31510 [Deinococcus cellulosilyticus NBRC 106333 = KACC 11606]
MKILVLIHVLSAIIGVGPTYFGLMLLRQNSTPRDLQTGLKVGKMLEWFPKIGGTLAVLSGFALILLNNYGPFTQIWLLGSLILYILIQAIVIGFVSPRAEKLAAWVFNPKNESATNLPAEQQGLLRSVSTGHWLAAALGTVLFTFMILKPH